MSQKLKFFFAILLAMAIWGVAQNPPATNPPPAVQAASPAVIGPAKLAFVNMAFAITSCDEGKKEADNLQKYIDQKNGDLQKMQKTLQALKDQLEMQGSKITDEARADIADQIDAQTTGLERFQQDTQKDIDGKKQKLQNLIGKKMVTVIQKLAKDKGLSVVQFADSNIYGYIDPSLDITDEVIKSYNQTYPAGVAPAIPPIKK